MRLPTVRSLTGAALAAASVLFCAAAATAHAGAGLDLPKHFRAVQYAHIDGAPRHIAVTADGTVYVNLADDIDGHGLMALADTNGDGRADKRKTFGHGGGTGLVIHNGWLYAATLTDIYRYKLGDALVPERKPEHLVSGMPRQSEHTARGLAVSDDGQLFVNIGAPSNACQVDDRSPGSKGQDPCPLLEKHGGIWRFSATRQGQSASPEARFATGVRNMFALAYHKHQLYGVQMGRDQLNSNWPHIYTQKQSVRLPAEQMFAIDSGDNFGWPYCYYDPEKKQKVLGPEYGGNGRKIGQCAGYEDPLVAFPAHWAPMDLLFYTDPSFPEQYRGGAFVAFHGSWNRAPSPQAGYRVVFQPFDGAKPAGHYRTFAGPQGFTGHKEIRSPGNAEHRPAGLAEGPDGALYISDDQGGTIFKVTHAGGGTARE